MQTIINLLFIPLVIILIRYRMQTASLIRQSGELELPENTNQLFRLDFPSSIFKKLVLSLNRYVRTLQDSERALRTQQQNLKWQMTSITHDLRTPLTSIIGYLDLMEQQEQTEAGAQYLSIVKQKSEVLQELISDFYEMTKIEDPDYTMEFELADPKTLLEDILMSYYDEFQNKGIDLHLKLETAPPVLLSGRDMLRVYANLIENILKYGEKEAWVTHSRVRNEIRTVFANRFPKSRAFDEKKMFDRFYSGSTTRNEQSSGLGLFTAQLLMTRQGHSISATVHRGILFITLSYRTAHELPAKPGIDTTQR
ncbi:MAG: HAMP domain-containing sensor histidine kinase [Bacillota bacterium]|nr:HAMP domain-containing sensor histidine kinase [Bacillota bacterium]